MGTPLTDHFGQWPRLTMATHAGNIELIHLKSTRTLQLTLTLLHFNYAIFETKQRKHLSFRDMVYVSPIRRLE